jgi:hypothetical protein
LTQKSDRTIIPTSIEPLEHDSCMQHDAPVLAQATRFVCEHWARFLAASVLVLAPCFWHREIVADDLGSHLYNAWLAQLVRHGQAPGLWIARQWTNVLFDFLLSGLGSMFGFRAAEMIAVPIAVLIFFWGTFALVSAATRRAPWLLLPCIALATYGWTFHMGFFNYYLSLGLGFFSLAIFWRGQAWERLFAIAIAAIVAVAHPLGFFWLLGAGAYIGLAERTPRRYQLAWFAAGVGIIVGLHFYLWSHFVVAPGTKPFYFFNGTDQMVLFGERYRIPELALIGFALVSLAVDVVRRRREPGLWSQYSIPLQLYVLVELAVPLFPGGVRFPHHAAPIALLTERLTSISIVLGCCLLGAMRPSKWHLAGSAAIAALFFSFVYQDTATVNKMEAQIVQLVGKLPPNQRVMGRILPPPGSRILIQHILDRACIGHCFDYGNYEPSAEVFRVRAAPGNPYVLSDYEDAISMEEGDYTVQPEDLPIFQIYQCSPSGTELCIHSLAAGEENDRLGIHPDE